jgi:hypothetical protein
VAILSANHTHCESFLRRLSTKSCCMPALHTVFAFSCRVISALLVRYDWVVEILLHKFTLELLEEFAKLRLRLTDLRVFLNL